MMSQTVSGWCRLLAGLVPVGLALVACSSAVGAPIQPGVIQPHATPAGAVSLPVNGDTTQTSTPAIEDTATLFVVNVDMTDEGYQPASIFIPKDRRVLLVLRNAGTTERHFRVPGLIPTNLLWLSEPEGPREAGVTEEDHDSHHSGGFVPWRGTSAAGIKPLGFEVHGYAEKGGVDEVLFTPASTGSFMVQDPLHPEITGKVTIF